MDADQYTQKLLDLSMEKLDRLRKILQLTEEQSIVITEDKADDLHKIINLKQQHMDAIDELDQAFEVYYSRLKSLLRVHSIEEIRMTDLTSADELKQIIASIYEITKKIQNLENSNNNKIREVLNKISTEIRYIKQGKMVNNGYNIGGKLPQQSYYFDKKK